VPADAETSPAPAEETAAPRQQRPEDIESAAAQEPPNPEPGEAPRVLEIPVIRDPTYYAVSLLDEYPRPLGSVEPRYPLQASRDGITGMVTLRLLIDETGTLNEISVVAAKPEAIFDEAAMAAFRDMRFSPARKDGRAVRSRIHITVGFEAK
jgi:protein TonB